MKKEIIRNALVEHFKNWINPDSFYHNSLYRDGVVNPVILRKIANSYSVSRGIKRDKENDIAPYLTEKIQSWPSNFADRVNFVYELASEANSNHWTQGKLLSGFSKIVWFICPDGWTMYDSLAANGITNNKKKLNYKEFYDRLEKEMEFTSVITEMRDILKKSSLSALWPERILDKMLMSLSRNKTEIKLSMDANEQFLNTLNQLSSHDIKCSVDKLADEIFNEFHDCPIMKLCDNYSA